MPGLIQVHSATFRNTRMDATISELYTIIERGVAGERALIATLEKIQERYRYLPPEALVLASAWLGVPLSQVYSVATFLSLIHI